MILSSEQGYIRIAIRRQNSQKKNQLQMNSRSLTDFINIEKKLFNDQRPLGYFSLYIATSWMGLMLISKRVCSINEVGNSITELCFLLIATVSLSSVWQAYPRWKGEFQISIVSLRDPNFPMSTAKVHHSWISFNEIPFLKPILQNKS